MALILMFAKNARAAPINVADNVVAIVIQGIVAGAVQVTAICIGVGIIRAVPDFYYCDFTIIFYPHHQQSLDTIYRSAAIGAKSPRKNRTDGGCGVCIRRLCAAIHAKTIFDFVLDPVMRGGLPEFV